MSNLKVLIREPSWLAFFISPAIKYFVTWLIASKLPAQLVGNMGDDLCPILFLLC